MFYKILRFIIGIFLKIIFKIEVVGLENIKQNGKFIVSPNHMSNWDPFIVSVALKNRQIHWMAKKELFDIKILGYFLNKAGVFPINREGLDISAMKTSFRILQDDKVLGIFPEGTRVKNGFHMDNVKVGASMIAMRTKTDIIPVHIDTEYKIFGKVKVVFGEPIDYYSEISGKPKKADYEKASEDLLRTIYSL